MILSRDQLHLGDVIDVYVSISGSLCQRATPNTCRATVIALPKDTFNNNYIIGWKPNEMMASPVSIGGISNGNWSQYNLISEWSQYTCYQCLSFDATEICALRQLSSATVTTSCQEQACAVCTKMNDIGINKCWWCEGIIK